jgi:hypothetical protein
MLCIVLKLCPPHMKTSVERIGTATVPANLLSKYRKRAHACQPSLLVFVTLFYLLTIAW